MNKNKKLLLTGIAIVLVVAAGGYTVHEILLNQAHHEVAQTRKTFNSEQKKLYSMQKSLIKYENLRVSNLKSSFPNTEFQKSSQVLLPAEKNYKRNDDEVAKWIVKYINELRELNAIDNPVTWNKDSSEQKFAETIAAVFSGKSAQPVHIADPEKYVFAGYSGVISGANPSTGTTKSDQETAYDIVMNLYDQSASKSAKENTGGDPDSRTFLLYSGKNIGVAASSGLIAFNYNPAKASTQRKEALKAVPLPDITFKYVDMTQVKKAEEKIKPEEEKVSRAEEKVQKAEDQEDQVEKYFF